MCIGGGDADAPEASPYETEMLAQAENRLKEYNDTFVPIEHSVMDRQALYGSKEYESRKWDEAVAGAKLTNSGATVAGIGMQPGSGHYLMQSQGAANASGGAAAMAGQAGTQVALDKKYGGALDIVKLGRNQTATSADLNSTLASNAAGVQAAQYQAAQMERNSQYAAAGTAIGMAGMAAYKKWGPQTTGDGSTN